VAQKVSGTYEGDMIRPLGLMTLYFGYAEYELDIFLERLGIAGLIPGSWSQRPIGQKLTLLTDALRNLDDGIQPSLNALLVEVHHLLERRNALIHSCIVAGGRVMSGRIGVQPQGTSADELTSLAERIFTWKEQLSAYRWRQVEPLLEALPK
jgi:hypothetical protein